MNSIDHQLDPLERALAERLAASAPQPSSALDARILAAAHAAAGQSGPASARRHARRQRRWPLVAGIAASVALALGIAWQLRPLPGEHVPYSETPAYRSTPATTQSSAAAASAVMDEPAAEREDSADADTVPADASASRVVPVAPAPHEAAPVSVDQPTQKDMTAAPAAPVAPRLEARPELPASAARSTDSATDSSTDSAKTKAAAESRADSLDRITVTGSRIDDAAARAASPPAPAAPPAPPPAPLAAPPAAPATPAAAEAPTSMQRRASDAAPVRAGSAAAPQRVDGWTREQLDTDPPATADDLSVQLAWLQRIRELKTMERTGEARKSLVEFMRRYPHTRIPDDLKPLIRPVAEGP